QAQQQGQAQLTQMLYLINRAKQGDQEAANQLKLAYDTGAEQVRQFNAQREDSGAGLLDWIFGLGNTAANMYSSGIFGGKQAASGSSGLGMGGAWFSDIRLKKNIKKIGEMKGINIYKWDWEDNVEEIVGDSPTVGVIAQEVAHIPNAVIMDKSGYLKVDYRWI
ncbi:tail fiber domain-containing protein, partial [Shewanella sp.]|uniref:tail fiber domain-containing protein n=1 Tax=Shewanella sp. TaxID=50422 RepID=UPI00356705CC